MRSACGAGLRRHWAQKGRFWVGHRWFVTRSVRRHRQRYVTLRVRPRQSERFDKPPMSVASTCVNGVARIQITRPEKKNAITASMYQSMADALAAANEDSAVRAIL